MVIIAVSHEKEVEGLHVTYCGVSPQEAASSFSEKFSIKPETVYQKVSATGRLTCYIPAPEHIMDNFSSGVFHGINTPN
jgi:hypothetical protein